jgi:hypothetical protein
MGPPSGQHAAACQSRSKTGEPALGEKVAESVAAGPVEPWCGIPRCELEKPPCVRRREPPAAGWGESSAPFDVFKAHEVSVADPVGVQVMVVDQPEDSLLGHAEPLRSLGDRDIAGCWITINHCENTIIDSTVRRTGQTHLRFRSRAFCAAIRGVPTLPSADGVKLQAVAWLRGVVDFSSDLRPRQY